MEHLLLALHVVGNSGRAHNTVFCHLILVLLLVLRLRVLILLRVLRMLLVHHLVQLGVHFHVRLPASVVAHWGDRPGGIVLGGLLRHHHRLGQIADHRVFKRVLMVLGHVPVTRLLLLLLLLLLLYVLGMLELLSVVNRAMTLVPLV